MTFQLLCFYVFATAATLAALGVITLRNPVHAVLCLVLTFFSTAAIWLLAEAEFLAVALVVVYVGAVMVLFLFVVMMLDINVDRMRAGFWKNLPVAAVVGTLIVLELAAVLWHQFGTVSASYAPSLPPDYSNTKALGRLIYTEYVYAFEIAAVILLVAMVAAIALTLRRRPGVKSQNPSEQVRVRREDRVRLVRMPAVKPAAPTAPQAEPNSESQKSPSPWRLTWCSARSCSRSASSASS
ncbi:MAG: NADH-quinone oxidoreductase subunit J [Xanthomonadaceae bacterium]|nr:NADH-quinone oxidoreductase subunit J [Xanthomonadaceae bacterium]